MRHTHGVTSTPPGPRDPSGDFGSSRARTSVGQVFAFVAGFVALAAIGATVGWTVTKAPGKPIAGPTASPTPTVPVTPTPTTTPSPSPSTLPSDSFMIPDYGATPTTFQAARDDLRNHHVGVTLFFQTTGAIGVDVTSTTPAAGTVVTKGATVKVFVDGTPPPLAVPALPVVPTVCADWGSQLAAAGFLPVYSPTGSKKLMLAAQSPGPDDTTTVWNQTITLTCTKDGQLPSSPPASGSPSPNPSDSTSGPPNP